MNIFNNKICLWTITSIITITIIRCSWSMSSSIITFRSTSMMMFMGFITFRTIVSMMMMMSSTIRWTWSRTIISRWSISMKEKKSVLIYGKYRTFTDIFYHDMNPRLMNDVYYEIHYDHLMTKQHYQMFQAYQ